jgi:hypothetical protein
VKWDQGGTWVPRWPVGHQVRTSRFTIDVVDIDWNGCVYVVEISGSRFHGGPDRTTMSELFIEDLIDDHHDHYGVGPVETHQPPPTVRSRPVAPRVRSRPRRSVLGFDPTWRTCLLGAVCAVAGAVAFRWGVTTYRVAPGLLACLGGFAGLSVGLALATEVGQRKAKSHRHIKEGKDE